MSLCKGSSGNLGICNPDLIGSLFGITQDSEPKATVLIPKYVPISLDIVNDLLMQQPMGRGWAGISRIDLLIHQPMCQYHLHSHSMFRAETLIVASDKRLRKLAALEQRYTKQPCTPNKGNSNIRIPSISAPRLHHFFVHVWWLSFPCKSGGGNTFNLLILINLVKVVALILL